MWIEVFWWIDNWWRTCIWLNKTWLMGHPFTMYHKISIKIINRFFFISCNKKFISFSWYISVISVLLVHLDQRSRWTIAITWQPSSVNFSHFKLLLWNHWADWNQTLQECSLDGPLQSYCFSFQSDIQYGCQGQ